MSSDFITLSPSCRFNRKIIVLHEFSFYTVLKIRYRNRYTFNLLNDVVQKKIDMSISVPIFAGVIKSLTWAYPQYVGSFWDLFYQLMENLSSSYHTKINVFTIYSVHIKLNIYDLNSSLSILSIHLLILVSEEIYLFYLFYYTYIRNLSQLIENWRRPVKLDFLITTLPAFNKIQVFQPVTSSIHSLFLQSQFWFSCDRQSNSLNRSQYYC